MIKNFYIEHSLDEYEILRVNRNNKWFYIGSKYNMKREIDIIQENIKKNSTLKSIIVFGSANGIWIDDIDKITSGKEILVVEPDENLYKSFIERKYDIRNNVVKATSMNDDNFYHNMMSSVTKTNFQVFVFANYDFIYKAEFEKFIDKVMWMSTDKMVGDNTTTFFSKIWFETYLNNIEHILKAQLVNSYKDTFRNKPAIVVSAGPSLDKNLKFLKENEDRFIIITGGRTLSTLRKEGIKADFTCVIDGSEEMYNVFKPALDMEVPLLFNEETSNKIVSNYKGEKIFFSTKDFFNASNEILGVNGEILYQGGSVAHACVSFAKLLGCDPIVFIGQDLAYTDDKLHSENSVADNESNEILNTEMYVKGVVADKVLTNYDLNIFRERLEMFIKLHKSITFINCTEGGAHIEGTLVRKLKDFIVQHNEIIDKASIGKHAKLNISKEKVVNELKNICDEIDNLISLCEEGKRINIRLRDLYIKSPGKYSKALNRLDSIDNEINSKSNSLYLFEPLIAPINSDLSKKFGEVNEEYDSILEQIEAVSEKGKYLNNELIKVFNHGKPLIENCIKNLEGLM